MSVAVYRRWVCDVCLLIVDVTLEHQDGDAPEGWIWNSARSCCSEGCADAHKAATETANEQAEHARVNAFNRAIERHVEAHSGFRSELCDECGRRYSGVEAP